MRTAPKGRSKKKKKRKARTHPWRRRVLLAALAATGVFFVFVLLTYLFVHVPQPNDISTAQAVEVSDHDGRPLGRFSAGADRVIVPIADMPEALRQAVIATEDRGFYHHSGIAPFSILRAAVRDVVSRGAVQGGSTITQQYVKNAFVGNERSIWRKIKEAVIAVKLERRESKDQILQDYLNTIYFGRGTYGVEAAARTYFGRHARDLSLPQCALLAGMIQAPETYDPARDRGAARGRRDAVLSFMVRDGYLTPAQAARAKRASVHVRRRRPDGIAPHFLEDLRVQLEGTIGASALYAGGVKVRSSLDRDMQVAADRAVRSVYDRRRDPDVALVALDPATGSVRAMVGSRSFARRELNLAMHGHRQPGSTFKAATLTTAIDAGIPLTRRFRAPGSITIPTDSGPWHVSNYDLAGHGTLTVQRATELSVNTVYAQLIMKAGPADVVRTANDMGVTAKLDPLPSLALGTEEVTPLDLTSMYTTLAARGVYREPSLVEEVTGADGEVLYRADRSDDRVLTQDTADTVNVALQGVIERGTGARAQIGRPAAGKTGTTEELRDAWFAGYTPDLAAVVWNGYPRTNKPMTDVRGTHVVGGSFPAQIWAAFMREALAGVPAHSFAPLPRPTPTPTITTSPSATSSTTLPSPVGTPSEEPSPSPTPSPSLKPSTSPKPSPSPSPTPSPSPSGG